MLRLLGMITVGCAGFSVPATRYFKEYQFVEIQETYRGPPGRGTIRRWQREAPAGFEFALLGPREIAQEGFRAGKVVESALAVLRESADVLEARSAVFIAAPEFTDGRANRAALKEFLGEAKQRFASVVFEVTGWDPEAADSVAEQTGTLAARDPLTHGPSKRESAYYRLPGPAGYKSRYEDPAIEQLVEITEEVANQQAHYVFANVDMFTDAKRFKNLLGF